MKDASSAKSWRLLDIYSRLVNGEQLKKSELALQYQVSEKSIQRDMSSLRDFMEERDLSQELIYDTKQSAYHLIARRKHGLCEGEMLAVGKILLDSRSLRRDEILPMLERLITCCIPNTKRKTIKDLLLNEEYHYIEPQHGKHLFNLLWSLGQAIQAHQVLRIQYMKQDASCVKREVEPVGLMFSEFYFYLVGFIQNINKEQSFQNPADTFPTIYRVDRINELHVLDKHFTLPYRIALRKASFVNAFSSCMEEGCKRCISAMLGHQSKPYWIVCLRLRSNRLWMEDGMFRLRYLVQVLKCGFVVKVHMLQIFNINSNNIRGCKNERKYT